MYEQLNLDELRGYVEDGQRRAKKQTRAGWIIVTLSFAYLIFVLLMVRLLLPALGLSLFVFLIILVYTGYVIRLGLPSFYRSRATIRLLLPDPEGEVYGPFQHIIHPTFEYILFMLGSFLGFLGMQYASLWEAEGLSAPPPAVVAVIAAWGLAAVVVLWWVYRLWWDWTYLPAKRKQTVFAWFIRRGVLLLLLVAFFLLLTTPSIWWMSALIIVGLWVFAYFQWLLVTLLINPYLRSGDYNKAQKRIDRLLYVFRNSIGLRYSQAYIASVSGDFIAAEQLWLRLLTDMQHSNLKTAGTALLLIGDAVYEQGRHDEAYRWIVACVEAFPENLDSYAVLAEAHIERGGSVERAAELLEFVRDLSRSMHPLHQALYAVALAHSGRSEESAAVLAGINEKKPGYAVHRACMQYFGGQIVQAQGQMAEAREYYTQAAGIDPAGAMGQKAREALAALPE